MNITASESGNKGARSCSVEYNLGENLKESAELFGEKVVHSAFISASKVTIQAAMRRLMKAGKSDEEIQETMSAWKPGVKAPGKSPREKAATLFAKLSEEERAKLLEDLREGRI